VKGLKAISDLLEAKGIPFTVNSSKPGGFWRFITIEPVELIPHSVFALAYKQGVVITVEKGVTCFYIEQ
jgi:hypothetical protein